MTTKPPSGTGLAAVQSDDEDATATSVEDAIGDILLDEADKPSLTLPAPGASTNSTKTPGPVSIKTPTPEVTLETPGPLSLETPAPLSLKTPAPLSLKTPGPTPAPLTTRDPSSVLPSIPPSQKESSGAFPLPGMAPADGKNTDEDKTLIARLSVLDDLAEESTKVEEIDAVLRAATKPEPIALSDQATAQREKALGVSAADRVAAAEFEEPGDEDEMTVSATPGIISISDDDDDEDDTTASQRPPSARKTPTPATGGPRLDTPIPLLAGGPPRLPPPTLPSGRTVHLPTPSGGLPPIPMPLASPASAPQRALTPALPIPAPLGVSPPGPSPASAIFNKVQLPMGGLVAFLVAAFGGGFVVGAWWFGGQASAPAVAVQAPAPAKPPEPAARAAARALPRAGAHACGSCADASGRSQGRARGEARGGRARGRGGSSRRRARADPRSPGAGSSEARGPQARAGGRAREADARRREARDGQAGGACGQVNRPRSRRRRARSPPPRAARPRPGSIRSLNSFAESRSPNRSSDTSPSGALERPGDDVTRLLAIAVLLSGGASCAGGSSGGADASATAGMAGTAGGAGTSGAGGTTETGGTSGGAGTSGAVGSAGTSGAGGTAGAAGAGGSAGTGGANGGSSKCPAGTFSPPTLAGLVPQRLAGVPPADTFAQGFSIIEGPVWSAGTLFVSQFGSTSRPPTSRLLAVTPGASAVVANADFGSNGMALDPQGNLIVAVHKDGSNPACGSRLRRTPRPRRSWRRSTWASASTRPTTSRFAPTAPSTFRIPTTVRIPSPAPS